MVEEIKTGKGDVNSQGAAVSEILDRMAREDLNQKVVLREAQKERRELAVQRSWRTFQTK